MFNLASIFRYYHTIKELRFEQIWFRMFYRLKKPRINDSYIELRKSSWSWCGPCTYQQTLFSSKKVSYLSLESDISDPGSWNDSTKDKLWLYNLHYFDDLNSITFMERESLHYEFINRWILENPPCAGNGWEPYPLSLRLVNWVKWFSKKKSVEQKHLNSIAQQANALSQQLEYHILGNHLFANAKALTFVGVFLQGKSADNFLSIGLKLLDREVDEQFLADGAHFELSPMYHIILLWDLLELINLAKTSQNKNLLERLSNWEILAIKALKWLTTMVHNDGEVSFFNDSAMGIAPRPDFLYQFAHRLGLNWLMSLPLLTTNKESGYSRIELENYSVIFDHGNVGPDYLPGHAHADTLSFEMSVGKQRLFVNSGTSMYGASGERLRQRRTSAHNTVEVSELDSSEVWGGFRVARRAYSRLIKAYCSDNNVVISASHDGYKRIKPRIVHTRTLIADSNKLFIKDSLSKPISSSFHAHLHPGVLVLEHHANQVLLQLPDGTEVSFMSTSEIHIIDSTWHPEFGLSLKNKKIMIPFSSCSLESEIQISKA